MYKETARNLLEFIGKSPSVFHVIDNLRTMLLENGFAELSEKEQFLLEEGKDYFVTRNDSSIVAFRMPRKVSGKETAGFRLVATHSDSPTFKVKHNPEMIAEDKYVRINTEKYGGMILSTWLDRPLSVAGRIVVEENGEAVRRLVNVDRDLFVIPNVAIHMNRDMNKGVEYNPQVDMIPLFAMKEEEDVQSGLIDVVAERAGVEAENILDYDLFLYVREQGRILGANEEFVLSPKLDDLQCVYAQADAFIKAQPDTCISVAAVFDNEEVGSGTMQGADSTFLSDVLQRICLSMGLTQEEYMEKVASSMLISADNAHAVHPNHPEKADPTNRPYVNGGPVIKYHGSQKYTTDAASGAYLKMLCKKANVPCQTYYNRSDIAGGSTLGNISTAHVSVASVDIGLPQLAMHSAMETAGVRDTVYAIKIFEEFFAE